MLGLRVNAAVPPSSRATISRRNIEVVEANDDEEALAAGKLRCRRVLRLLGGVAVVNVMVVDVSCAFMRCRVYVCELDASAWKNTQQRSPGHTSFPPPAFYKAALRSTLYTTTHTLHPLL